MAEFTRLSARPAAMKARGGPRLVVLDVDGTLTDGRIYWDGTGKKLFKSFSPDDGDALSELRLDHGIDTFAVSKDAAGFNITWSRAHHMKLPVYQEGSRRLDIIHKMTQVEYCDMVYIADGWGDGPLFRQAGLGIAPQDALERTRSQADIVINRNGGDRFVAAAVDYLIQEVL